MSKNNHRPSDWPTDEALDKMEPELALAWALTMDMDSRARPFTLADLPVMLTMLFVFCVVGYIGLQIGQFVEPHLPAWLFPTL